MKKFAGILIIALILILITVFLPLFEAGGGTFNFKADPGFINVCKLIFNDPGLILKLPTATFTAAVFIPAVLLLIFSLARSKVMCIISSLLGIGCLGYAFFAFSEQASATAMYFGDVACIPIATWAAALLFIIAFIWACALKTAKKPAKK